MSNVNGVLSFKHPKRCAMMLMLFAVAVASRSPSVVHSRLPAAAHTFYADADSSSCNPQKSSLKRGGQLTSELETISSDKNVKSTGECRFA